MPAADAELILAEAEDHLYQAVAAGMAAGLTEPAAQQAAVTGFGLVRAVLRAHHRPVTARDAVAVAWQLSVLLATTVGAGGLAGIGIFAYAMRTSPAGMTGAWDRRSWRRRPSTRPGRGRPGAARDPLAVRARHHGPVARHHGPVARLVVPLSESWMTPYSYGSVTSAPLVAGAVIAACLAAAAGFGIQAVIRRIRTGPKSASRRLPHLAPG